MKSAIILLLCLTLPIGVAGSHTKAVTMGRHIGVGQDLRVALKKLFAVGAKDISRGIGIRNVDSGDPGQRPMLWWKLKDGRVVCISSRHSMVSGVIITSIEVSSAGYSKMSWFKRSKSVSWIDLDN